MLPVSKSLLLNCILCFPYGVLVIWHIVKLLGLLLKRTIAGLSSDSSWFEYGKGT